MSTIIKDKLYLGDICNANDTEFIRKNNITSIVCVATDLIIINNNRNIAIHYYQIEDDYDCNILQYFDEISQLIDEEQTVLVNCYAGISRSATIVIAYMMRKFNMNLNTAFLEVREARNRICPNKQFMQYLLEDEKNLFGENSLTQENCTQLFFHS